MVKTVLLTLIGLAFVAVGVFLLARGDPENATLAWGVIVFFGACAAVGLVQLLPVRKAQLNREGALVLRPLRAVGTLLAGIAMGLGCLIFAPYAAAQGDTFISYVCYFGAVFFGGGSLFALCWTLFGPPLARIDASGVETFDKLGWKLAWRDVIAIRTGSPGRDQGWIEFAMAEPTAEPIDEEDADYEEEDAHYEEFQGRILSVADTRLAFEDVSAIVHELWQRHRGD